MVKKKKETNTDSLENNLEALKSKIRVMILQQLKLSPHPVKHSELAKKLNLVSQSPKLSYHLNELRRFEYIGKNDQGYYITAFGEKILESIEKMTEIIQAKKSKLIIRTSKYTFVPFDVNKIEGNLIQEANIPVDLAKKIAIETKNRLEYAKITYLTAPLIREYINAILIEMGYETYRHKLTRLGLPPFDISKLIANEFDSSPEKLFDTIGKSTIEQYVLLNLISQKHADLLLSASLSLTNLSLFGLSSLELVISGAQFITWINIYNANRTTTQYCISNETEEMELKAKTGSNQHKSPLEFEVLSMSFTEFKQITSELISFLSTIFPIGLNLIRFDQFLSKFLHVYSTEDLQSFCGEVLSHHHFMRGISLQVSSDANIAELEALLDIYITSLSLPIDKWSKLPKLQVHITKEKLKDFIAKLEQHKTTPLLDKLFLLEINHHVDLDQYYKWGIPDSQQMFSTIQGSFCFDSVLDIQPTISVEKIGINLLKIALESQNERTIFWANLEKMVHQVFDLFEIKMKLLSHSSINSVQWQRFIHIFLIHEDPWEDFSEISTYTKHTNLQCGLSFYGLDECIFAFTQLNMKDVAQNRVFAQEILDFIFRLIDKQNKKMNSHLQFVLVEPHVCQSILDPHDGYLQQINESYHNLKNTTLEYYSFFTQFPKTPVKLHQMFQIYDDWDKTKYSAISLNLLLNENNILAVSSEILDLMHQFLTSKIIHMSISRIYRSAEDPSKPEKHHPKEVYTRYFSQYTKIDDNKNLIWEKLIHRQDFLVLNTNIRK